MDLRVHNFLAVFCQVAKIFDDDQTVKKGDRFVKPGFSNKVFVVYNMPIFKEIRGFCNF
jgi:hypothetical protein